MSTATQGKQAEGALVTDTSGLPSRLESRRLVLQARVRPRTRRRGSRIGGGLAAGSRRQRRRRRRPASSAALPPSAGLLKTC